MTNINRKATGGQFGTTRVLPTMTIHAHENGTFFVTDDWKDSAWISGGHVSIADAVKAHGGRANRRLQNKY